VLKKGDVVEAMVLSIDAENQAAVVGPQAAGDRHLGRLTSRAITVGDTIGREGHAMTNFGAFGELDEGIRRAHSRVGVRTTARPPERSTCRWATATR